MAKHHLDGWQKNFAVMGDHLKEWWIDMQWNATRLIESARERDWMRVLHFIHAFVSTTFEKLYRVWAIAFWAFLVYWITAKVLQ